MKEPKKYPTFTDPYGVVHPFKGVTEGSRGKRLVAYIRCDDRDWSDWRLGGEPFPEGEWVRFGNAVHADAMDKRVAWYERLGFRVRYCFIDLERQLTLKEIDQLNQTINA